MGHDVTGPQLSQPRLGVRMTVLERERYVRWWIERSGLTARQLRQIATGIWSDRVLEEERPWFTRAL